MACPSRSRGVSWRLRLKAIDARTGEGQPESPPLSTRDGNRRCLQVGMIGHGPESVLYVGWDHLRLGGAVPPGADFYGMASYDRGLVSTTMGELGRTHRGWWPRSFRV